MKQDATITIRVPQDLKDKFVRACDDHGTTPSKQLRMAIYQLVKEAEREEEEFNELVKKYSGQ